jgi:glutaminyl-peptide cyclotransferase
MAALVLFTLSACAKQRSEGAGDVPLSPAVGTGENPAPVNYSYEVVNAWPHDPSAFTQGLVFHDGRLLESTGLNGESTLREVEIATGRVLKHISVPPEYFAEGLTVIGTRAYQLTWRNHKGFVYDVASFQLLAEFAYEGEGWGLTTDGKSLIMSDGTNRIRFLDPDTFRVTRSIDVVASGQPVTRLNELEWIKGEIFANIWQSDTVVRIDPSTGVVRGLIDFPFLLQLGERGPATDVMNGIAYDPTQDKLYLTGKRWPKMYEVRLKPKPAP